MIDYDKTGLLTYLGLLAREAGITGRTGPANLFYALIDIDLFKKYNTELGYDGADAKLRQLAQEFKRLESEIDQYDAITKVHPAHMSGDEFVVVFETSDPKKGQQ